MGLTTSPKCLVGSGRRMYYVHTHIHTSQWGWLEWYGGTSVMIHGLILAWIRSGAERWHVKLYHRGPAANGGTLEL